MRVSGGGFESDGVAEGFELAYVVALASFGVDALGVVARSQVEVAGVGVGEQVPGDDEDGVAEGGDGALGSAAAGDATVALAEEGSGRPALSGQLYLWLIHAAELPFQVFLVDLPWGSVTEVRSEACVLNYTGIRCTLRRPPRVLARRINGTVDALVLQRSEERLGHRIIEADTRYARQNAG